MQIRFYGVVSITLLTHRQRGEIWGYGEREEKEESERDRERKTKTEAERGRETQRDRQTETEKGRQRQKEEGREMLERSESARERRIVLYKSDQSINVWKE